MFLELFAFSSHRGIKVLDHHKVCYQMVSHDDIPKKMLNQQISDKIAAERQCPKKGE